MIRFNAQRAAQVNMTAVDNGAPAIGQIVLPDGIGYYILRKVYQRRTAGAAAATQAPSLAVQPTMADEELIETKPVPVAAIGTIREQKAVFFFAPAGIIAWSPGADVVGDTWKIVLIVEKIR